MSQFGPARQSTPAVVSWYRLYCLAMCLLYLAGVGFGLFFLSLDPAQLGPADAEEITIMRIQFGAIAVVCAPLMLLFGAGALLPRKPWAWVVGVVLIALGMTSICCLPATIPLIIFWVRDDARRYYGMRTGPYPPAAGTDPFQPPQW